VFATVKTNAGKCFDEEQSLFLNLEKSFDHLVYAKQMALAFADFCCSKPKSKNNTYAQNVLEFIDISVSEGRETSQSSTFANFATESIAT